MSQPLLPLLVLAAGYLLGSLPTGWLAGRWLAGIDLRQLGSGSTGATNVLRQLGKGPALVVFLVDVLKGTAAVLLAKALLQPSGFTPGTDWWVVAAGLAALAGHIWPVWLGWKGARRSPQGWACCWAWCRPWAWPASGPFWPASPSAGSSRSPASWQP